MNWPIDEAAERLAQALLIYKETKGDEATIHYLQQELTREHVIKQLRPKQTALLPAPAGDAAQARDLDQAAAALQFYADPENYNAPKGRVSKVARDKGRTARDALTALDHDDDGDGEGGK